MTTSHRGRIVVLASAALTGVSAGMGWLVLGPPSGSASAEASAPPPEAASVVCEAFSDGGPMDNIAFGLPPSASDVQLGLLSHGVSGLLAVAERASGDERVDLLALATAVDDLTTDWGEATKYSPDEFHDLPQDAQAALQNAAQDAWDALRDAQHAFYRQYTGRCGVALDTARTVDCGPLEPLACERAVAGLIAGQRQRWEEGFHDEGLPPGVPVLYVGFGGTRDCISHREIRWPGGNLVAEILC